MSSNPLSSLMERFENSRFGKYKQFIGFALVGVSNTVISYAVEMLFLYVLLSGVMQEGTMRVLGWEIALPDVRWAICSALGFIAGVINSYFLNSRYVFREDENAQKRSPIRTFLKLAASSVLVSLVLSYFLKLWISGQFGLPAWLASLCALVVTIPLNFILSKFWAFRQKKK